MEAQNAAQRIYGEARDGVRLLFGDLLNIHAALGRDDKRRARERAIENEREIKLPLNAGRLFYVDFADFFPLRACLRRDEKRA